jgi:hypothetical protein
MDAISSVPLSRLVVVDKISYQGPYDEPTALGNGFSRLVDSREQVYRRRINLNNNWVKLDLGWLSDKAGMILLEVIQDVQLTFPSEETKLRNSQLNVELGINTIEEMVSIARIRLGESMRFEPIKDQSYYARCPSDSVVLLVAVIPE